MSTTCYANNGLLYENTPTIYVPCNITAIKNGGHSACCAVGDLCMTKGLCMHQSMEKNRGNHYWRNGCTDKTFQDPACPKFCRGNEASNQYNALILYCFDPINKYCCTPQGTLESNVKERDTSYCNDGDLTFNEDAPMVATTARMELPHLISSAVNISSSTSSPTFTLLDKSTPVVTIPSTSVETVTPSSSLLSPPSSETSLAKASLGVGITLAFLAGVVIVTVVVFLRRRKRNTSGSLASPSPDSKSDPTAYVAYESGGTSRAELGGAMLPVEMHQSSNTSDMTNSTST